ncbi:hypothetical protein ABZ721_39060 [Streptomyces sp. NPDC006733]|uniref:hypothetical protein n=1 Tax=Streptomyces sp. NPDC006733 TaxID=3155460 RepID=UPI00340948CF
MAVSEDLLWDAADKSSRIIPRLWRVGVTAGCLGLLALTLSAGGDLAWARYAAAACAPAEIAYWLWDRRRLVEVRIAAGQVGGPAKLQLRRVGGSITEHDAHTVARVLVIHDNVDTDAAKLHLSLRRGQLSFARSGRSPALTAWRQTCPRAEVRDRNARWGMPGIPD